MNSDKEKNRGDRIEYIPREDLGKGVIEGRFYDEKTGKEKISPFPRLAQTVKPGSYRSCTSDNSINKKEGLAKKIWEFLNTDIKDLFRKKEYEHDCSIDSDGNFLLTRYDKRTGKQDLNYLTKLVTISRELLFD